MTSYLAIDIGGTQIKSALVTSEGALGPVSQTPTPDTMAAFLEVLDGLITQVRSDISGVAISCPGKIDPFKGYVYLGGSLLYLQDLPLKERLESRFQLPCSVMNDAKAALVAEAARGGLQDRQNALILTLGTGLGGAILLNGQPLQGQHFQAGELSFVLSKPDGSDYENWWASQASGVSLVERLAAALKLPEKAEGPAVFAALTASQDSQAWDLLDSYCQDLALIIYNLHTILDLEKVLIGGGISRQPLVLEGIRKAYQKIRSSSDVLQKTLSPVEIDSCAFKNDANLLGAVLHLLEQIKG